jgi:hypothetical protein
MSGFNSQLNFRLELKMRIQGEVDVSADLLPEGNYRMMIEDAGLWSAKGRLSAADGKDLWWLLAMGIADIRFDRVSDMITHCFVAKDEGMFNLSDVLLAQLFWNKGETEVVDWLAEN